MAETITDIEVAKAKVKLKCAFDQTPKLEDTDIISVLEDNELISIWAPETPYKLGSVIIPTSDNRIGRILVCVSAGISATTEPDWKLVADRASGLNWGVTIGNIGSGRISVQDGTASWVDHGMEEDLWDIEQAIYDAWMIKASKAADLPDINRAGNSYGFNAIYRNCVDQAARYGGKFIK